MREEEGGEGREREGRGRERGGRRREGQEERGTEGNEQGDRENKQASNLEGKIVSVCSICHLVYHNVYNNSLQ